MPKIYVHDLDPFAIQFTETLGIRWYGLAYLTAFILGYLMLVYLVRRKAILLPEEKISDFTTFVAIGVLAGGRLGYALFYAPELFLNFHSSFPYWGVLEVNKGGMASHGGVAGVMLACWIFGRWHKISMWHLLDLTTLAAALGFFFGRIANFINGELYGRECSPTLSWAVKFPQEMYRWMAESPEKLKGVGPVAEAISPIQLDNGQTLSVTASTWNQWVESFSGRFQYNIQVYIDKIIEAVQNHQMDIVQKLEPVLTPRYPSQLIQSFMEGFLVFVILFFIWRVPRKPGVISAWFGILYALMRILGEQFRMPDSQIGFQALGLTRGQWLSFGLLAAGLLLLFVMSRKDAKPLGGWQIKEK